MSRQATPNPAGLPSQPDYSKLDEAGTRELIDRKLRAAGWEADTENLRFSKGARPRAGTNRAIAEWPTASGPADYVLFIGLRPVAVIEAKRHIVDVAGRVPQARRYSSDYTPCGTEKMPAKPWGQHRIPFVFAIRRFQNEQLPKIAVTVDLLTTGIDVHEILNVVFIRRVRSRILYEQMLGRATRLCPNLHGPGKDKEFFRIFDAVDLYAALEDFTTMKPVVKDPSATFAKLVEQLSAAPDAAARKNVRDELLALLRRKRRALQSREDALVQVCGKNTVQLIATVQSGSPQGLLAFFQETPGLAVMLDELSRGETPPQKLLVSDHPDALHEKSRGYGKATKPDDYLASFGRWVTQNLNRIPALIVVTQRPRDLTRQHLKEIKFALDGAGYTEASLRTAWREWKNEDMAATIVGFIRNRAMGAPLRPYAERVDHALQEVLGSRSWTNPQRQWLQRIANQTKADTVVDRDALDRGIFEQNGGFARLNRLFDGQVETVLADFRERIWQDAV